MADSQPPGSGSHRAGTEGVLGPLLTFMQQRLGVGPPSPGTHPGTALETATHPNCHCCEGPMSPGDPFLSPPSTRSAPQHSLSGPPPPAPPTPPLGLDPSSVPQLAPVSSRSLPRRPGAPAATQQPGTPSSPQDTGPAWKPRLEGPPASRASLSLGAFGAHLFFPRRVLARSGGLRALGPSLVPSPQGRLPSGSRGPGGTGAGKGGRAGRGAGSGSRHGALTEATPGQPHGEPA